MNLSSQAAYNSGMTAGRILPWLQDTSRDAVWASWKVTWRDLRILDAHNRLFAVYNLTEHSLEYATNRTTLKRLLIQAAQSVDSNRDGLPDDWQLQYFGDLSAGPQADSDSDALDNFTEFAFGTDPTGPRSLPPIRALLSGEPPPQVLTIKFRRRAGSILDYHVETSADLRQWSDPATEIRQVQPPRNLFDGTGTAEATYSLTPPVGSRPCSFVRVRAVPRQP